MPERPKKRIDAEDVGYVRDEKCQFCRGGLFVTAPDFKTIASQSQRYDYGELWYIMTPKMSTYCHKCYPSPPSPYRNLAGLSDWCKWQGPEYTSILNTMVFLFLSYNIGHHGAIKLFRESEHILNLGMVDMKIINKCLQKEVNFGDEEKPE